MKILYYLLNLTWGLPMTFIGAASALVLTVCGKRPESHAGCLCYTVGKNWGGVSLGLIMICDGRKSERDRDHEFGHSVQNAVFGIFMPFIVCIPSAVRYRIFNYRKLHGKINPPYDSVWFEGQATRIGVKFAPYFK